MKKITFLILPLFCLLLLGAGCAEEQDFDKNTTTPSIDNNSIPYYEINLDDGHIDNADGTIAEDSPVIDVEYAPVEK
jgi:hypothetical protein